MQIALPQILRPRIASLQPSISLTLAALHREHHLCALTKYCLEAMPSLAAFNLPVLHDSWSFDTQPHNLGELLAAEPDLVIASVPYRMESLAAILKAGRPALTLAPNSLADIFADIRLLAALTHAAPEGETLIAHMQAALDAARAATGDIPTANRPRVYCEEWGKPLIHSQHWVAELVEAAGGTFVGTPGTHTNAEAFALLPEGHQPDVLVFAWCGAGNRVPLARVIAQRGWHSLPAVIAGRVHCIPDEYLNMPAPTLLEGLACLAAVIHPELFSHREDLITLASGAVS